MEEQQLDVGSNTDSDTTSPGRGSPASQPSDAGGQQALPSSAGSALNSATVVSGTPRAGGLRRRRRGAADWEIMQGLRSGQRCDDRPSKFEGYLLKRRKWPLKGWHKRFFCLDKGMLTYAKSSTDMAKGKIHGSVDLGLSVLSTKSKGRRVDIDAEEFIYHLKVKNQAQFQQWISQLRHHRLYRQHEIAFGSRDAPKMTSPVAEDSGSMAMTGGKASCWPSSLCCYACDRATSKCASMCDMKGSTFSLSLQSTTHQCYRDLTYNRLSLAGSCRQDTADPQIPSCSCTTEKKERKPCFPTPWPRSQRCPRCTQTTMAERERKRFRKANDLRRSKIGIAGLLSLTMRLRDIESSTDVAKRSSETTASANVCCIPVDFVHHEAAHNEIAGDQKYTTCGVDTNEGTVMFVPVEDQVTSHTGGVNPNEVDGVFVSGAQSGSRTREIINFFEQASVTAPPATRMQHHQGNNAPPHAEGECSPRISRRANEIGIDTDHGSKLKIFACNSQISKRHRNCPQQHCCYNSSGTSSHDRSSYKSAVNGENYLPPPPPLNSDQGEVFLMKRDLGPLQYDHADCLADWTGSNAKLQQHSRSSYVSNEQFLTSYSTVFREPSLFTGSSFKTLSMAGSTTDKNALPNQPNLLERRYKCLNPSLTGVKACSTYSHDCQERQCETGEKPCTRDRIVSQANVRQGVSFSAQNKRSICSYDQQGTRSRHGSHISDMEHGVSRCRMLGQTNSTHEVPIKIAKSLGGTKRAEQFQGSLLKLDTMQARTRDGQIGEGLRRGNLCSENDVKNALSATSDVIPKRVKTPRIFLYSRSDCTFVKDPVHFLEVNKGKIEKHDSCSENC